PEKRILDPWYGSWKRWERSGTEGIVANAPLTRESSGLSGRSCGAFPGTGRTLPSHRSLQMAVPGEALTSLLLAVTRCPAACQICGAFFRTKFLSPSLPRQAVRCVLAGWVTRAA